MTAELRVSHLDKTFGSQLYAVRDVSFTAAAGEIVVLLGPSGCGKTTTLRCVAGLEHPTGGTISIGGRLVDDPANGLSVAARHRRLGMVFQSYAVWPHMTVAQNVEYPLRHRKVSADERRRKVREVLELVSLAEYAERSATALSGGQMQRVALARSLVYQPDILLLDEPLSNLDAKLRLRLRDDLRRILKDAGVTALYVTHDQAEAVVLGDRIGVMKDGRLLQIAEPLELYNQPSDSFVANFTGASNVIPAEIAGVADGSMVAVTPSGDRVLARYDRTLAIGDHVQLAARPDNMALVPGADHATATNTFPALVTQRQFLGDQIRYQVTALGTSLEVVESGTTSRFAAGDRVVVVVPPDLCWAFRAETAEPASGTVAS